MNLNPKVQVHSAEFGLGKSVMTNAIEEEALEAIDRLKQFNGKDILIDQNFNIPIFNVLWRIAINNRYSVSPSHKIINSEIY